jgi:adenylate cyclase class IV
MSNARKEVEVKAKINDYKSLLIRLDELGISLSKASTQSDQIFWPIGTKFEDLISEIPVLRIRSSSKRIQTKEISLRKDPRVNPRLVFLRVP